jgi:hypothetical protein
MTCFFELTPGWPIRKPDHAERTAGGARLSSASGPSGLPGLAIRAARSDRRPIVTSAAFATKLGGSAR